MSPSSKTRFVVLKFGGTSVASKARWEAIGSIARARLNESYKPIIVCSAVSGVSNALEMIVKKIAAGEECASDLQAVKQKHIDLCDELSVSYEEIVSPEFAKLEQRLLGASLIGEMNPRIHAAVMAQGEILSTLIGAAFLRKENMQVAWSDARQTMRAIAEPYASEERRYLAASCDYQADALLQHQFAQEEIILTQGFIASNEAGQTVLLGRGGSDTSASYFAAKLGAVRCEIWTDVPGMYTANPRQIPQARLLNQLDYQEAQEMATMGAKVLHPRCIAPVARHSIPLHIRCTNAPDLPGTVICEQSALSDSRVKSISTKSNITLLSIEALGMWQEVGFLADLFQVFKKHGVSIDLVSTSETNVTVSIDPVSNALQSATLTALCADLETFSSVKKIAPCAAVSLVGRNIRSILHQLGPALSVFEEQKVYLMSQAASDLNLTFVVQQEEAERLTQKLHHLLFGSQNSDPTFGPTWQDTFEKREIKTPWWQQKREELLQFAVSPTFVYDELTLTSAAQSLTSLSAIDRVFYATKANNCPDVLRTFEKLGLGFECVSLGELNHVRATLPGLDAQKLLFTPNFAPRAEYEEAFRMGCHVTLDNLFPLEQWPELFANRVLFLRLDPGQGKGHHRHVHTGGEQSKFGISLHEIDRAGALLTRCKAKVVGLHAHAGSGITEPGHWAQMAHILTRVAEQFEEVEVINLGGGLSVPADVCDDVLDLSKLNQALLVLKAIQPKFQYWLEPGRFLVAHAGVLLTKVTQLKEKGNTRFVGVDTGMNSLIRPALYGAYHHIVNLTRLDDNKEMTAHVVGPICESGDTLGFDRRLPHTKEGDVLLIATAGAYGHVMGSEYNLRQKATEHFLKS